MANSPTPPVRDPTSARATAENEMLSPAPRALSASPVLARPNSSLPSITTVSNISPAVFVAANPDPYLPRISSSQQLFHTPGWYHGRFEVVLPSSYHVHDRTRFICLEDHYVLRVFHLKPVFIYQVHRRGVLSLGMAPFPSAIDELVDVDRGASLPY